LKPSQIGRVEPQGSPAFSNSGGGQFPAGREIANRARRDAEAIGSLFHGEKSVGGLSLMML
jgi:hypothetical protein